MRLIIKIRMLRMLGFAFICLFSYSTINAQVTIGSGKPPAIGTLLDLKEYEFTDPSSDNGTTATKGFNLPRVRLVDINKLLPMFDNMKDANTYSKDGIDYSKTDEDAKHIGLMVYNLADNNNTIFTEGLYYWDGQEWIMAKGTDSELKFFYMPSFILDTSTPHNSNKIVNLYEAYKNQFTGIPSNRRNPTSKQNIPVYDPEKLDYYVTGFDNTVLNIIGITDNGILTYQTKATATGITYINVVFVVK